MTDRAVHVHLRGADKAVAARGPAAVLGADRDGAGLPPLSRADVVDLVRLGAAVSAAILALTSTGSMVIAAAALVVALSDRRAGLGVILAVAAVAVRLGTVSFDDVAGVQSVLGAAVEFGPETAAASAWAAAVALVLATRPIGTELVPRVVGELLPAVATGAFAAAIAAGPGPGGDLWMRVVGTVVGFGVAVAILQLESRSDGPGRDRSRSLRASASAVAGIAAVVLAAWPAP